MPKFEKSSGFKMKGMSFVNSPMKENLVEKDAERDDQSKQASFRAAFAKARKDGKETFVWEGKKYTTAREDDPTIAGQHLSPELKDIDSGKQYKDPHGHVRRYKSGEVVDDDYKYIIGKSGNILGRQKS